MKTKLITILAVTALITSAYSELKKSDSDLLQGKWQGTEKGASPDGPYYLTITEKNLDYRGVDTNDWLKGTFTLDETTKPKHFTGVIKDCPDAGSIGKKVYAIYKLEDGKLIISGNAPGETNFPSAFDAADARQFVFKHKSKE